MVVMKYDSHIHVRIRMTCCNPTAPSTGTFTPVWIYHTSASICFIRGTTVIIQVSICGEDTEVNRDSVVVQVVTEESQRVMSLWVCDVTVVSLQACVADKGSLTVYLCS